MPLPTYLMSNFPSVRPSLNLQFDSQPTPEDMTSHLASVGATFSRASIGTYTDANGIIQEATSGQARPNYSSAGVHEGLLIEESRTNLIESSQDFTVNWLVGSRNKTVINQAIAPDGTASADLINSVNLTNGVRWFYLSKDISTGTDYTASIYAKAQNLDYARLAINTRDESSKWVSLQCDLSDGSFTTLTNGSDVTLVRGNVTDVGNDWYRLELTVSTTDGEIYVMASLSDGTAIASGDSRGARAFAPSSLDDGIYLWGAQFEAGSFPTSYIPTIPTFTSRASDGTYFDSSGVLQTTSGERIDHKYIDGQWVEAGLLLEGASTNETPNSEGVLPNGGSRLDRDGTTVSFFNGDSPNAYATNGTGGLLYVYETKGSNLTGSTTYTTSLFVRLPDTNPYNVSHVNFQNVNNSYGSTTNNVFDLVNGTIVSSNSENATIEEFPDGWYRISITDTTNVSPSSFDWIIYPLDGSTTSDQLGSTGDGEDVIYVYAVQTEEGSQPTSYIATSGGTADRSADLYDTNTKERSADVCYIDGTAFTDFYNQEEGTVLVDAISPTVSSDTFFVYSIDDGVNERIQLRLNSTDSEVFIGDGGVTQASLGADVVSDNTDFKYIFAYKVNDFVAVLDGGTPLTDTSGTLPTPTELNIGMSYSDDRQFSGGLKKLIYFPRRLGSVGNNAEIIKLTQ